MKREEKGNPQEIESIHLIKGKENYPLIGMIQRLILQYLIAQRMSFHQLAMNSIARPYSRRNWKV